MTMADSVGWDSFPIQLNSSTEMTLTQDILLQFTTLEPYERPFTDTGIVISAAILLTFVVVGLVGNVLTIIVIKSNEKLRNIFMIFILSLCVSDLCSALISWLFLYRRTWGFDVWAPLPNILCRFYWASDLMTNYVTAWHILFFAILRYVSCQFPMTFSKISLKHGRILISSIWILSFFSGFIPFFIFFDARTIDRTSSAPNARWPACTVTLEWLSQYTSYQKVFYPLLLYVPTVCMIMVSVLLCISVCRHTRSRFNQNDERKMRKERQAVLQVFLIVVSFLIGYVPFTAYEFWSVQPRENTMYNRQFDYWFGVIEYYFLRFSECLNPIFYNLASSKIRHYTKKLLLEHICCHSPKEKEKVEISRTSAATRTIQQIV